MYELFKGLLDGIEREQQRRARMTPTARFIEDVRSAWPIYFGFFVVLPLTVILALFGLYKLVF